MIVRLCIALTLVAALSACSQKPLRDLRSNDDGPEEFMVLPSKPLTQPESFAELPQPTPGGANITDPTPKADAIVALGGRPQAAVPGSVPSGDAALVNQARRYGATPDIREQLAAADEKFRKRMRRSGRIRLFPVDRYAQSYRREDIEPFEEQDKWRRAGVVTPTAPPERF
jgi:hypothetical protein